MKNLEVTSAKNILLKLYRIFEWRDVNINTAIIDNEFDKIKDFNIYSFHAILTNLKLDKKVKMHLNIKDGMVQGILYDIIRKKGVFIAKIPFQFVLVYEGKIIKYNDSYRQVGKRDELMAYWEVSND